MSKIRYYIVCALVALFFAACTDQSADLKPNTPMGNFETLWQIIDEKYPYFDEKNSDWTAIGDEYRTKIAALDAIDERGLFTLLASMLDSLRDGHVNLYSSFDVSHYDAWYADYADNFDATLLANYLGDYMVAGSLCYNRIANDSIGLIRYSSFSSSFSAKNMYYVLSYFADCKGIILDVRDNGGGDLENAYKLASTFFDVTTTVGYWQHKTGTGHHDFSELQPIEIDVDDMPCKWLKPVIVLTNRSAYSATNSFVNAMKNAPNALILGDKTGGGGGMPLSYELPNGWLVRLSSVPMYDVNKSSIEAGIDPDVCVSLTDEMAAQGKDDMIERAVSIILGL